MSNSGNDRDPSMWSVHVEGHELYWNYPTEREAAAQADDLNRLIDRMKVSEFLSGRALVIPPQAVTDAAQRVITDGVDPLEELLADTEDLTALRAALLTVLALHRPEGNITVGIWEDASFGPDGEIVGDYTSVKPDSFEEIASRETLCMACLGRPQWPCSTYRAIAAEFAGLRHGG